MCRNREHRTAQITSLLRFVRSLLDAVGKKVCKQFCHCLGPFYITFTLQLCVTYDVYFIHFYYNGITALDTKPKIIC